MQRDEELARELQEAASGLLMMSESDHPFKIVRFGAQEGALTPERLRRESGAGIDAPVEVQSVAEFFRAAVAEPEWKGASERATARRFQALRRDAASQSR